MNRAKILNELNKARILEVISTFCNENGINLTKTIFENDDLNGKMYELVVSIYFIKYGKERSMRYGFRHKENFDFELGCYEQYLNVEYNEIICKMGESIKLNYYEFDTINFEYYGLVYAESVESARKYYEKEIADLNTDKEPCILTKEEARKVYINSLKGIDDLSKVEDEFELIDNDKEPCILLVDNNLI